MCAILTDTDAQDGLGTAKRSSLSFSAFQEQKSKLAKRRGVHIGDGVLRLPGAPPPFRILEAVLSEGSGRFSPRKDGCAFSLNIQNMTSSTFFQRDISEEWAECRWKRSDPQAALNLDLCPLRKRDVAKKFFTIGYGSTEPRQLISILKENGVEAVVDVRLWPHRASMRSSP
jgi:hypothetical protein